MKIDLNFPRTSCPDCNGSNQVATTSGSRYAIRCAKCGRFLKWASAADRVVIEARKAFLDSHKTE